MIHFLQNIINYFKRTDPVPISNNQIIYKDFSHLYNQDNSFTDEFFLNLVKTINWTESIISHISDQTEIDYSKVLRATNPDYYGSPFYRYENTGFDFAATPAISFNYKIVLEEVLRKRQEDTVTTPAADTLGQVLEFDIDLTTHDGVPCAESAGFVDESDIPPIDTWFYLTQKHLYCWIPNMFIEKMQAAIDVEIFYSYRWIKDAHPYLHVQIAKRLRAAYNSGSASVGLGG